MEHGTWNVPLAGAARGKNYAEGSGLRIVWVAVKQKKTQPEANADPSAVRQPVGGAC